MPSYDPVVATQGREISASQNDGNNEKYSRFHDTVFGSSTFAYICGAKFRSAFRFDKSVGNNLIISKLKQVIRAKYDDSYLF